MARWHLAAGVTADSVEELREHIAQARRWAPRDPQVLLAAARVEAADGQVADALDLCAAAAQVLGEFPVEAWRRSGDSAAGRSLRRGRRRGGTDPQWRPSTALPQHRRQQTFWELQLAGALNDVAYARALADQDVAQALPEIEQALELAGENSAMLDTRGYALWRLGQAEPARRDLDRAVELAENELAVFLRRDFPRLEKERVDMRPVLRQARLMQRSVAVLRYHRAMAVQGSDPERAARTCNASKRWDSRPDQSSISGASPSRPRFRKERIQELSRLVGSRLLDFSGLRSLCREKGPRD